MYMPSKYMAWKKQFALLARVASYHKQEGRLCVSIVCAFVPPKSCNKKEYEARIESGTPVPDLDNCIKAIADAIQDAGLFDNDSQICKIVAEKKYAAQGGVWVTIEPYESCRFTQASTSLGSK